MTSIGQLTYGRSVTEPAPQGLSRTVVPPDERQENVLAQVRVDRLLTHSLAVHEGICQSSFHIIERVWWIGGPLVLRTACGHIVPRLISRAVRDHGGQPVIELDVRNRRAPPDVAVVAGAAEHQHRYGREDDGAGPHVR